MERWSHVTTETVEEIKIFPVIGGWMVKVVSRSGELGHTLQSTSTKCASVLEVEQLVGTTLANVGGGYEPAGSPGP